MDAAWLLVLAGYLLGSLLSASIVGRLVGRDPTRAGSGNPGATNMVRIAGKRAGAIVLVADVAKGVLAAGVGYAVDGRELAVACGAAAVVGHIFPLTRRFRGGKGVATFGGVLLVLYPVLALVLLAIWILIAVTTKRASVASIVGSALAPVGLAALGEPVFEVAVIGATALVIVVRHRGNLRRLVRGEELEVSP